MKTVLYCLLLVLATDGWLQASKRKGSKIRTKTAWRNIWPACRWRKPPAPTLSLGSIWVDSGRMASLSADYKAMDVGDMIEIVVVQGLTSSNANSVDTARTLKHQFGIDSAARQDQGREGSRTCSG